MPNFHYLSFLELEPQYRCEAGRGGGDGERDDSLLQWHNVRSWHVPTSGQLVEVDIRDINKNDLSRAFRAITEEL